jgi:hypothetical protein
VLLKLVTAFLNAQCEQTGTSKGYITPLCFINL